MKKRVGLLGLFLAMVLVLSAPLVQAATPEGVQVKPLRNYPALDRGSTGTGSLTLTNTTKTPQTVTMAVELFSVAGDNYEYTFSQGSETDWISFKDQSITLQPSETKTADYTIAVPGDATAGGHYFSLLTIIDPPKEKSGITEIKRIASLLYLEVSGSITKKTSLVGFSLPWLTFKPVIPTDVSIANNGTSHTRARVLLEGRSGFSKNKSQYALLEGLVMPGTARKLTGEVKLPNSPGLYTITAQYSPTQGGTTLRSKTVLYAPIWFIAVIVMTLLCLVFFAYRYLKHARKTKSKNKTN